MSPCASHCYYCGSRAHSIRDCQTEWQRFGVWNNMFCLHEGYKMDLKWDQLHGLDKKSLMRIACLSNVQKVYRLYQDTRGEEEIPVKTVTIKLKQDKAKLVDALVDRYNNNKEMVEEFRREPAIKSEEDCPICYDKLGDAVCTTTCGHKFCTPCFVQTVSRSHNCPMCRANLKSKPPGLPSRSDEGYRQESRPVRISWTIDRNPDSDDRRYTDSEYLRRRGEVIDDLEHEEVGF